MLPLWTIARADPPPTGPAGPPPVADVRRALPPILLPGTLAPVSGCAGEAAPRFYGEVVLSTPSPSDAEPVYLARDATGRLLAPAAAAAPIEAWLSERGSAPVRVRLAVEGGVLTCTPAELVSPPLHTVEVDVEVGLRHRDTVALVVGCGGSLWVPGGVGARLAVDPSLLPCEVRAALVASDGYPRWGDPVLVEQLGQRIHVVAEPLGIQPLGPHVGAF